MRSAPYATRATAETAGAREFLRLHAGGTELYRSAEAMLADNKQSAGAFCVSVAELLEQWMAGSASGLLQGQPYEVRSRVDAATDLMEQVDSLLSDSKVHPAAPIMLAGAALEEVLRSLWEKAGRPSLAGGRPSMDAYAEALVKSQVLDRQDVKDVKSMAGRRNEAAHGEFEKIDDARVARGMVDQVNLFLQRHAPR